MKKQKIQPYLDHTDQIFDIYRQLNLQSIDDFHGESSELWDGRNFMTYFTDVTRSRRNIFPFDKSDFKIYDDFVILSGDIKFCVGMLHYLYPHISKEPNEVTSSLIDRRYIMHVSFGMQSIYHFWDRIGDLLWLYFPTNIKERNVYTGKVLDSISEDYKSLKPYLDLKENYNLFKNIITSRHDIVHKCSLGTELYWQRIHSHGCERKLNRMIKKVQGYKSKLTESLPRCIQSLNNALELILELPEKEPASASLPGVNN